MARVFDRPKFGMLVLAAALTVSGAFSSASGTSASVSRLARGSGMSNHAPNVQSASTLDLGCPSPPGPSGTPSLLLKVTHWCGLSAPRKQWQIKIQLRIKNTGTKRLGIQLRHIWLAMTSFNPRNWTPPARQPGLQPFQSTYQGSKVWLVPANPDRSAEPYPPPPGNFTFATHWNAPPTLAPGKTFYPAFHRGDAGFYVPRARRPRRRRPELTGVRGIAYVNGSDVIDICPPERWPAKTPAQTF
jgi:hypothetical protein